MVNTDEVKLEAKKIMDDFMQALSNIDLEENFILQRESCYREEKEGLEVDLEFRERFFKNAPKLSGNAILANKGDWTKNN